MTTKNKKKRKRKKILAFLLLIAGAGLFLYFRFFRDRGEVTPTVTVINAQRGNLQEELSVEGTVAGEEIVVVYAPASGEISEVFVRSGDEVKKGDPLVSYDLEKLETSLYQAKLQNERSQISYENTLDRNSEGKGKVKEANANITILKRQIKESEEYLEDLQNQLLDYQKKMNNDAVLLNYNLKKKQAEFQEKLMDLTPETVEYEAAQKELASVQAQLEQLALNQSLQSKSEYQAELEKMISQAQETLAGYQSDLAKMESQKATGEASVLDKYGSRQLEIDMELTELAYQKMLEEAEMAKQGVNASVQGVVTNLTVAPHGQVSAGMQFMTIERTDAMKVSAMATSYVLERLKVGQMAEVTIGSNKYAAEVSHVDRFASSQAIKGSMAVGFEVRLLEVDDKIYLGSNAKMTIFANKAEDALLLPTQAVRANKFGDFVFVVQDGKVLKKSVTCGIITNGKAQILSGITETDVVILDYEGNVDEGMAVLTKAADMTDY